MMNRLVVTFSAEELLELQGILLDEDETAALKFLQDCVGPKLPAKGTAPCDSTRRNPFLLKPE